MRQMMFSTVFPKGHPRHGEHTFFVPKIWESMNITKGLPQLGKLSDAHREILQSFVFNRTISPFSPKLHTIRAGQHWKEGDEFAPKIWSGRPYNTETIQFAPPLTAAKVWAFEKSEHTATFYLEGKPLTLENLEVIAGNDGLSLIDFYKWFDKPFEGQIICWDRYINYPENFKK